jgi:Domain of unknown function (DUF4216)
LIHKGDKIEDEPFIFPSQADQVFYVRDHVNSEWFTALGVKPSGVHEMGNEEWVEDAKIEPYHVCF